MGKNDRDHLTGGSRGPISPLSIVEEVRLGRLGKREVGGVIDEK